jgi:transcriptional regulator with XRE-family HTH domain
MYGGRVSRVLHSPPYQKLRRLLSEARAAADLTQAEVASRMDRPQSFVSKYESGERHLDVIEFVEVCAAIGVSPAKVMRTLVG